MHLCAVKETNEIQFLAIKLAQWRTMLQRPLKLSRKKKEYFFEHANKHCGLLCGSFGKVAHGYDLWSPNLHTLPDTQTPSGCKTNVALKLPWKHRLPKGCRNTSRVNCKASWEFLLNDGKKVARNSALLYVVGLFAHCCQQLTPRHDEIWNALTDVWQDSILS